MRFCYGRQLRLQFGSLACPPWVQYDYIINAAKDQHSEHVEHASERTASTLWRIRSTLHTYRLSQTASAAPIRSIYDEQHSVLVRRSLGVEADQAVLPLSPLAQKDILEISARSGGSSGPDKLLAGHWLDHESGRLASSSGALVSNPRRLSGSPSVDDDASGTRLSTKGGDAPTAHPVPAGQDGSVPHDDAQ